MRVLKSGKRRMAGSTRLGDNAGLKNQWGRYSVPFFPFPREACLLIRCRQLTKTQESICLLECGNTTPVKHDTTIYYSAVLGDFLLS